MRRFKSDLYRYFQSFMRLPILFYFIAVAILVWLFADLMYDVFPYKFGGFVTADIVLFLYDTVPLSIGLLAAFAVCIFIHYDFKSQYCLCYKSRLSIFIDQLKKTALFCVISSLFILIEELFYGLVRLDAPFSNFTSTYSAFFAATKHLAEKEPNPLWVCTVSFLMMSLILFIVGLIMLASKWVFNNYIIGFFVIVVDGAFIMTGSDDLFFYRLWPDYMCFYDGKQLLTNLPVPLITAAAMICVILAVMRRREFTDAKK